jgi:hypothetical protein
MFCPVQTPALILGLCNLTGSKRYMVVLGFSMLAAKVTNKIDSTARLKNILALKNKSIFLDRTNKSIT